MQTVENATAIPFEADVNMQLAETVQFRQNAFEPTFDVKVIRHPVTSPTGTNMIFNAVGYLWEKALPDGNPVKISSGTDFEFEPAYAPGGKSIVYVSWNDENMGAVMIRDFGTPNQPRKLTPEQGIYRTPSYSPDGLTIVFQKDPGNSDLGFLHSTKPGIYIVPADGSGEPKFLHRGGKNPIFSADGKRIFFETGFGMNSSYRSIDLNGQDERTLFSSTYAKDYTPSPDNKWIAFRELHQAYITPFPQTGQSITLSKDIKAVPVSRVTHDAGRYLHWSADSEKLHWVLGDEYFTAHLITRFSHLEGAPDSLPPIDTVGTKIGLSMQADVPEGVIALINARIITMNGDEVIEGGTVIVERNIIRAVGAGDELPVSRGATIIDCEGKTLMPGLVDVHAHMFTFRLGLSPQKQWSYWANLAYGITTTHDPSVETEMTFTQSEMVRAGIMKGPRIFSTGRILYGADGDFKTVINSLDDAKSALRRTKAFGAFSVKSYNQPRRDQRQQVIHGARDLEIMVFPEGGSFFYHNMTMVVDGHTGVEHNIPVAPLYNDVINLWSNTKTANTPTLIVNYGSVTGEYYWYQHTDVWEKERLLRFMPRPILDSRARHRTMIPDEEYENGHILTSQSCKKLLDAGVRINLGSHGQLQGLGAHWELWMLEQGGMTNLEALRAATMNGAIYIGMDHQIGSIEAGKLADLIVIDGNPLENIRDTEHVVYTMINGRIYDSETMHEIGNYESKPTKFYWEQEGSGNAWPMHMHGEGYMLPKCLCRM
jgi:imidazolonepropionase-like amidohydrolase